MNEPRYGHRATTNHPDGYGHVFWAKSGLSINKTQHRVKEWLEDHFADDVKWSPRYMANDRYTIINIRYDDDAFEFRMRWC